MPITLTTTVGDASANSYADVAQADARAALRIVSPLAAAWLGSAETERKKSALISATMDIDSIVSSEFDFYGEKASETQALEFPRDDSPASYPANLVAATIELAFTLLPTAASEPLDPVVSNTKRVKSDQDEVEFFAPAKRDATSLDRWPRIVQRLMASLIRFLVTSGDWGTGEVVRTS